MFSSVIIPIWNKRPHIARAIHSVLSQSFQDFEIIAIDDCSTDGSIEELKKIHDPRIRIIVNTDGRPRGPGGARNLGISAASGNYVSFLDADDAWGMDYLREMHRLSEMYQSSGILACAHIVEGNSTLFSLSPYSRRYIGKGHHSLPLEQYLKLSIKGLHPLWTSVITVKKTIFEKTGVFPEGVVNSEDIDLWLRIMAETTLAWSPYIGATYFYNTVNKLTKHNLHNNYDLGPTFEKLIEEQDDARLVRLLKKHKNFYIVLKNVPKIKNGIKLKHGDLFGISFIASPWLSLEAFLLLVLPVKISKLLLDIRRTVKNIPSLLLPEKLLNNL